MAKSRQSASTHSAGRHKGWVAGCLFGTSSIGQCSTQNTQQLEFSQAHVVLGPIRDFRCLAFWSFPASRTHTPDEETRISFAMPPVPFGKECYFWPESHRFPTSPNPAFSTGLFSESVLSAARGLCAKNGWCKSGGLDSQWSAMSGGFESISFNFKDKHLG